MESAYAALLEEHRTLQSNHDDVVAERDDVVTRLRELRQDQESNRHERSDGLLRAEIDRLQTELLVFSLYLFNPTTISLYSQKSEDNLNTTESNLEKYQTLSTELERKIEELQTKADEAVKLKDQLDE